MCVALLDHHETANEGWAGSNDIVKSTIHRVRAPAISTDENGMTPERYSIPYVSSSPP